MSLASELIVKIVQELNLEDFSNLRLVSKDVYHISSPHFAKLYFRSCTHLLERRSLETLLAISKRASLAPAVHRLIINPSMLVGFPPYHSASNLLEKHEFMRRQDDQLYLQESGEAAIYISSALMNLPNCKAISIAEWDSPFSAEQVFVQRQTGGCFSLGEVMPNNLPTGTTIAKRVLRLLLAAVVANRVQLEKLRIWLCIGTNMLILPEICSSQVQNHLSCLRKLYIQLNLNVDSIG